MTCIYERKINNEEKANGSLMKNSKYAVKSQIYSFMINIKNDKMRKKKVGIR